MLRRVVALAAAAHALQLQQIAHFEKVSIKSPEAYAPRQEVTVVDLMPHLHRLVKESKVALLLKEQEDKSFKGSLRSRTNLDVQQIASLFGGGGHKAASGFSTTLSMEEITTKVKNAIRSQT